MKNENGCKSRDSASRRFHQHFTRAFFVRKLRFGSFSSYVLALAPKFCTKITCKNVDEIDNWGQYHQHFTRSFYACKSQISKKTDCLAVFFVLLWSGRVKAARKMLVKSTPVADPIKLFFFANEKSFRLFLLS